jgi:hypothetical protein
MEVSSTKAVPATTRRTHRLDSFILFAPVPARPEGILPRGA